MKTLPTHLSGNIQWLYNGSELPTLSKENNDFIIANLDPQLILREEFNDKFIKEILDPYSLLKHKFQTLRVIAEKLPEIEIQNITLALLFEDLCKAISISLSDIVDKTIQSTRLIESVYLILFTKRSLRKIVEEFSKCDSNRKNEYINIQNHYDLVSRDFFKLGLNDHGQPYSKNFENIRNELFVKREKIKDYRDNVAAHISYDKIIYLPTWLEMEAFMKYIESLISNIYFLGTYRGWGNDLDGAGLKSKETIEWFSKGLIS